MSSQILIPNTEAAILSRVIEEDMHELTPDSARYLLSMKLPEADENRLNELSAQARQGALTPAETQELDSYLHIGFLLGIMQSKARARLKVSMDPLRH